MVQFQGRRGPVIVRKARADDAKALLRIHRGVIEEGDFFITTLAELSESEADKRQLATWLNSQPHSCLLVAEHEGRVRGFASVRGGSLQRLRHVGRFEVMVEREARGLGVGKALMDATVRWATDNFFIAKLSLSVFADNAPAVSLYESFGFLVEGRRVREYQMGDGTYRDDLLMSRWVG